MSDTKEILVSFEKKEKGKKINGKKEIDKSLQDAKIPKKRKVTVEKKWQHSTTLLHHTENSLQVLRWLLSSTADEWLPIHKLVFSQISAKITSYRSQDIEKSLFDETLFVNATGVVELLILSEMKCHFCGDIMQLLYEYVREPKQWSLDRIDNALGHNRDNVYATCLSCNLRRKTIHHDRFYFTKQVRWEKVDGSS